MVRIRGRYSSGAQHINWKLREQRPFERDIHFKTRADNYRAPARKGGGEIVARGSVWAALQTQQLHQTISTSSIDRLDDETHPSPHLTLHHGHHQPARLAIDLRRRLFTICGKRELEMLQQSHDNDEHFQDACLRGL